MSQNGNHLVITVHGIRTYGSWQPRLQGLIQEKNRSISVFNYTYGYFSIIAFLIPMFRWLVTRKFRRRFVQLATSKSWDRIDIVAHSFGTHVSAWGLYGIAEEQRPVIHTFILAGSVLKPEFPWQDLIERRSVQRVINECGAKDSVLALNQFVVLFTGMAGRVGFHGMLDSNVLRNRVFDIGHSDYFRTDGVDNEFMEQNWLPLIVDDEHVRQGIGEVERATTAKSGLFTFFLNNLEPIKLCFYLAPFIAAVLAFNALREEAIKQKQSAVEQEAIAKQNEKEAKRQEGLARENEKKAAVARNDALEAQKKEIAQRLLAEKAKDAALLAQKKEAEQRLIAQANEVKAKESAAEALKQTGIAEDQKVIAETNEKKAVAARNDALEAQKKEAEQRLLAQENEKKAIASEKEAQNQRLIAVANEKEAVKQKGIADDKRSEAEENVRVARQSVRRLMDLYIAPCHLAGKVASAAKAGDRQRANDALLKLHDVARVGATEVNDKLKVLADSIKKENWDTAGVCDNVLDFSGAIREEWEKYSKRDTEMSRSPEMMMLSALFHERDEWIYDQILDFIDKVSNPNQRVAEMDRDRFWGLYYGELVLIETGQVESAMVSIGGKLTRNNRPDQKELDDLRTAVKAAMAQIPKD